MIDCSIDLIFSMLYRNAHVSLLILYLIDMNILHTEIIGEFKKKDFTFLQLLNYINYSFELD